MLAHTRTRSGVTRFIFVAAFITALVSIVALSGCTATRPKGDPALQGVVTSVSGSGAQRTIMVVYGEGLDLTKSAYDAASVAVTKDTVILGTATTADDLVVGTVVNVWFTGPVRESYPVQATASYVETLRQVSTSDLPTPQGLAPPQ